MSNTKYACLASFVAGVSLSTLVYYLYEKYNNKYSNSNKKCSKRRKRARHSATHVKPAANELLEKTEENLIETNMIDALQADLLNVKTATEEPNTNNEEGRTDIFNAILMMADTKQLETE